jgi:hypothetical protein
VMGALCKGCVPWHSRIMLNNELGAFDIES